MRTLALLGLVVALLLVTSALTPVVAASETVTAVVHALGSRMEFNRVYNRVFEVLLVIALIVGWRRLDLGGAAAIGLSATGWTRALGLGLRIGLVGITVGLAVAWLGGGLVFAFRYDTIEKTIWKTLEGLAAALLVGVGEEALFRGVLLRRIGADCGRAAGVAITTGIYAVVHVLREGAKVEPGPMAGFERTLGLFAPVADPSTWSTIGGLALLGFVLAWARLRTGSLWVPIGIHAAWVAVFRVGRIFFRVRQRPEWLVGSAWPPLIGGAAGIVGVVVTGVLLVRWAGRRRAAAA